jgi:hypothetical protein
VQISSLVYPMAALVFLTFFVMHLLVVLRTMAVRTRKISPRHFKLNKGGEESDTMVAVGQNYSNLLELPVLFYVVCIIAIILNQSVEYFIIHAWIFVGLRYIHSYIHITYNNVLHRLFVYATAGLVLLSMWAKVVLIVRGLP